MKMKKGLALLLAACSCFAFAACEEEAPQTPQEPEHEHAYATEWTKDETDHWHACMGEDCTEVADKAVHEWNAGEITTEASASADGVKTFTCTVCAQTKTEAVTYQPTEEEIWQNAFDNSKMTNCTVRLEDPNNGTVIYKVAQVDGDRVVYISGMGMEYYLVYTAENTYIWYAENEGVWTKNEMNTPNSAFTLFNSYAAICPNFGTLFDEFTYDTASQAYQFVGVEDTTEIQTNDIMANGPAKYYEASVKLSGGKLVQVSAKMSGQNGKTDVVYFEDYGTTEIQLPTVE